MITESGAGQPEVGGRPGAAAVAATGGAEAVAEGAAARRVARNAATPFAANLVARVLSVLLAMVTARTLGASGTGQYAVAVNLWLYASIVSDFGLGVWLTRQVARDPAALRETSQDALGLRLLLSGLALPLLLLGALGAGYVQGGGADPVLLATVALLGLGLLPGALSATGTSLFNAHEEMTVPAAVQLVTAALTTAGGIAVLLAGFGVVALAWVSLAVNLATAGAFIVLCRRRAFPLGARLRPARQLALARESFPLMLNGLLNNVFFRFDVQVLQSKGAAVVGYYANAYKVIDAAGAVPSSFVLALFPLLSRRAGDASGDGFGRVYRLALKLLLAMALAIALPVTYLADAVVLLFAGPAFLPDSAVALRILIWFLPLSFFNGLTQYVLIAVGRQQRITMAFAGAALFNVGANLLLIPRYGYVAAAGVTIASEVVLLVPFLLALRGRVDVALALRAALRLLPAGAVTGAALWVGRDAADAQRLLVAGGAVILYLALLPVSGAFERREWRVLLSLVPARFRPA